MGDACSAAKEAFLINNKVSLSISQKSTQIQQHVERWRADSRYQKLNCQDRGVTRDREDRQLTFPTRLD